MRVVYSLQTGSWQGQKKISASAKQKNLESEVIGVGAGSLYTLFLLCLSALDD